MPPKRSPIDSETPESGRVRRAVEATTRVRHPRTNGRGLSTVDAAQLAAASASPGSQPIDLSQFRDKVLRNVAVMRLLASAVAIAIAIALPSSDGRKMTVLLAVALGWLPSAWFSLLIVNRAASQVRWLIPASVDLLTLASLQVAFPAAPHAPLFGGAILAGYHAYLGGRLAGYMTVGAAGALTAIAWSIQSPIPMPAMVALIATIAASGGLIELLHLATHERRVALASLRDGEQRVQMLVEQIPAVLWTTDASHVVTSCLGTGFEAVNQDAHELLGVDLRGHPNLGKADLIEGQADAFSGRASTCEFHWDQRTFQAFVRPLRNQIGVITGAITIALDITDRKKAEEAKSQFLATASHELKTPLTVIQGFTQTLLRSTGSLDSSTNRAALESIERRAIQLSRIVENILMSGRIESGRAQVDLLEVDLEPLISERVRAVQATTERDIRFESAKRVARAFADRQAVATIVDHLLDNAIKYSPDGGPIVVSLKNEDGAVGFTVSDKGVGMNLEQCERCFDRFWQAEATDVRRFEGTGIGLFIVKALVDAMGGAIRVESEPFTGARFHVDLVAMNAPSSLKRATGVADRSTVREFMKQIGIPSGGKTS